MARSLHLGPWDSKACQVNSLILLPNECVGSPTSACYAMALDGLQNRLTIYKTDVDKHADNLNQY